ncbi:MAG: DUF1190 domain-containing protein [Waterburya sp.]
MSKNVSVLKIIRRKQIQQSLAISASLAILMSGCGSNSQIEEQQAPIPAENGEEKVDAVFYENLEQCQADVTRQQEEYQVLTKAFDKGELKTKPVAPVMQPQDCQAQMEAAQQEHARHAPVYSSLAACQSEGVVCESTPVNFSPDGYRPVFGGTYFYPYGGSNFIYLNTGGRSQRVYHTRTVYRSLNAGEVVTPTGRTVTKSPSGKVTVPRYTTTTAPTRPQGVAAKGAIKGRSSQGFGSTFKSSGSRGK